MKINQVHFVNPSTLMEELNKKFEGKVQILKTEIKLKN